MLKNPARHDISGFITVGLQEVDVSKELSERFGPSQRVFLVNGRTSTLRVFRDDSSEGIE
ncbi:MAG: hypothetical protein AWU57_1763 [Marinobacter sp. T13-3]|nr:MAG: hypothetical protein AWU57_1763 [Marinobacter sp. T13-3]